MMRQLRLPFYLAWQYIKRGRKWTLLLTIVMMTVAFVNLIFVPSLFNGIIDGANQQIINTMTGDVYITPADGNDYINQRDQILSKLVTIDGIEAVSSKVLVPGRLKYKNIGGSWQIMAINPDNDRKVSNISQKIVSGSYLDVGDSDQILIGIQIAGGKDVEENERSFKGAKVGEKVTLVFDGTPKEFNIKGIFDSNFVDSDNRAFITEDALKEIMPNATDKATTISIKTKKTADDKKVIEIVKQENIEGKVYSWQEATGLMESVSSSFLSINVILSFTSVLIAAVTIVIIIYITIINKRKDIGILRAIGIKPYIIVFSYVILSAVYAFTGVVVGSILFFAILMPYFQANPFVLPICDAVLVLNWPDYIVRAEAIIWISILGGFVPAVIVTRARMLTAILGK